MGTSNEKKRKYLSIIQRVYLLGNGGSDKICVLEMNCSDCGLDRVIDFYVRKQMWRLCALNLTLNSLFTLEILHII